MENKNLDCPLCRAKGVIVYTKPKMVTHARPVHSRKNQIVVGNFSTGYEGGGYDLSHAKKCPKLYYVVDKEGLLKYHLFGEGSNSDFLFYEDYQSILKTGLFKIEVEMFRKESTFGGDGPLMDKNEWRFRMFIRSAISSRKNRYLETESDTPEKVFDLLRHRLLCGEVIYHTRPGMQLIRKDRLLVLTSIYKKKK